jgi:hypothetical protein
MPQLHLGPIPRGYTATPFSAISGRGPDRQTAAAAADLPTDPPDNGYCELCLIGFAEAAEHRRSREHQRRVTSGAFDAIDELIGQVAAMRRI